MLERSVEAALQRHARSLGGDTVKIFRKDWPDRLVLLPFNAHLFVECKRPGQHARPMQRRCHARLRRLGHTVLVEDGTTWSLTLAVMRALVTLAAVSSGGRAAKRRAR